MWDNKGENNDADYFTKHHAPQVHRDLRYKYLLRPTNVLTYSFKCVRGCVSPIYKYSRIKVDYHKCPTAVLTALKSRSST